VRCRGARTTGPCDLRRARYPRPPPPEAGSGLPRWRPHVRAGRAGSALRALTALRAANRIPRPPLELSAPTPTRQRFPAVARCGVLCGNGGRRAAIAFERAVAYAGRPLRRNARQSWSGVPDPVSSCRWYARLRGLTHSDIAIACSITNRHGQAHVHRRLRQSRGHPPLRLAPGHRRRSPN